MKVRQATIADVAERAGVTRSVVSVVLSGHRSTVRVSESTRSRVMQAAREIDYRPSLIARGLQERKSFLLAYLCTGGGSWGVSTRLLRSIQTACRQNHYSLAVYPSENLEEERINLRAALDRQVDGIIVSPYMDIDRTNAEQFRKIAAGGLPVVQIGQILPGIPWVARDCRRIGSEAARMLIRAGRKQIVFITYDNYDDPLTGPVSHAEYEGYREEMEAAGLPLNVIPISLAIRSAAGNVNYKSRVMEQAYLQIRDFLARTSICPDAVLASSNSLGYAAGLCCRDSGWRIPEQTAIVSCSDDYVMPSVILPKLSGFPLAAAEIGRTAVQWCLDPASRSEAAPIRQFYREEESFLSIKNNNKTNGGVPCVKKDCQP